MDDWIPEEAMADCLMALGIEKDNVKNSAAAMYITKPDATFMEIYGGGSLSSEAEGARRSLNLKGLGALHLRTTKPDGTVWRFNHRADRKLARHPIDTNDPD